MTVAGFEPATFCKYHLCDADALPLRHTVILYSSSLENNNPLLVITIIKT